MKIVLWPLILMLCFFANKDDMIKKTAVRTVNRNAYAVVELFTSEGCSSCPAADAALVEVGKEYGSNVFTLSFHVDYWNYLGWKDQFSDALYSKRQQQYASVFKLESIYTPQVIINGSQEFVGSDKQLLGKAITESLEKQENGDIQLTAAAGGHNNVTVAYNTKSDDNTVLNIAFIQLRGESDVKRGENSGRKLKHIDIVRGFKTVSMATTGSGSVEFETANEFDKVDYKIIAYLQNKNTLHIAGAVEATIK